METIAKERQENASKANPAGPPRTCTSRGTSCTVFAELQASYYCMVGGGGEGFLSTDASVGRRILNRDSSMAAFVAALGAFLCSTICGTEFPQDKPFTFSVFHHPLDLANGMLHRGGYVYTSPQKLECPVCCVRGEE